MPADVLGLGVTGAHVSMVPATGVSGACALHVSVYVRGRSLANIKPDLVAGKI